MLTKQIIYLIYKLLTLQCIYILWEDARHDQHMQLGNQAPLQMPRKYFAFPCIRSRCSRDHEQRLPYPVEANQVFVGPSLTTLESASITFSEQVPAQPFSYL